MQHLNIYINKNVQPLKDPNHRVFLIHQNCTLWCLHLVHYHSLPQISSLHLGALTAFFFPNFLLTFGCTNCLLFLCLSPSVFQKPLVPQQHLSESKYHHNNQLILKVIISIKVQQRPFIATIGGNQRQDQSCHNFK